MSLLKNIGAGIALSALAVVTIGSANAETWDMPTPYPDKTFHTVNIVQFAKDVSAATGGALTIKIHSAGSLFKHKGIKSAVRGGQVPIGEFFLGLLANEHPAFGIDTQPFLATNYDDAERLWSAQRPTVVKLLEKQGLQPLFSVPWPPQGLYTKKDVNSVADLRGLKFRTYNPTLANFVKRVGAAPTQVQVPDIPQAFSTGRVEAMITSPSTGANSKAWDFLSHYTDIQAWVPKNIVVVNKRAFRRLDKATQQAVLKAAKAAESRGWKMSRAETVSKTEILRKNGLKIVTPSAELMKGLRTVGAQMLEDWKKSGGAEGASILSAYGN
jgi:TRAP-type C4-dicarboxylate transport system substrate-binding protein